MATIRKREGKKGTSYQVQVRLKGGEMETASFKSLTKAKLWAQSIEASMREGWINIKTGILRNCVFATFSKNIKHLTFAGCQSEIPFNFSQLLSIPFESEVLLPICYQIFDDVLGRCQGVFYKKRVF